jgi:hypothetical protein
MRFSLAEDLATAVRATEVRECKLCDDILVEVSEEEADAIRGAMSSKLGAKRISEILKRHGHDVGLPTVNRHRQEGHQ